MRRVEIECVHSDGGYLSVCGELVVEEDDEGEDDGAGPVEVDGVAARRTPRQQREQTPVALHKRMERRWARPPEDELAVHVKVRLEAIDVEPPAEPRVCLLLARREQLHL